MAFGSLTIASFSCKIMFDVAMAFAKERGSVTSLKEIRFTNFDEATVNIFMAELKRRN